MKIWSYLYLSGLLSEHDFYQRLYFIICIRTDRPEQTGLSNSIDPDEMLQNVASRQGLHHLPPLQLFLNTTFGSKLFLFKFKNKYGKELRSLNT